MPNRLVTPSGHRKDHKTSNPAHHIGDLRGGHAFRALRVPHLPVGSDSLRLAEQRVNPAHIENNSFPAVKIIDVHEDVDSPWNLIEEQTRVFVPGFAGDDLKGAQQFPLVEYDRRVDLLRRSLVVSVITLSQKNR